MDFQRTVEDIRSLLQSGDHTLSDRLRNLAKQYHDACQLANDRLRRCDDNLKQGLKAEALHLAQAEPALLDIVAVLDFPERPQFEELILMYGLTTAPKLLLSTAQALNSVYAEAQPLQHLLRKHRLLALGRGPLGERLAIMRELLILDGTSPFWEDDVKSFEKVRRDQLQAECQTAFRNHDVTTLQRLSQEVQGMWVEPPSPALRQQVVDALRDISRAKARNQLQDVAADLIGAYSALDQNKGRAIRMRWNQLVDEAKLENHDPLWGYVGPALNWLKDDDERNRAERAYQEDLDSLTVAFHNPLTKEELEDLMRKVQRHGRGIPQDVMRECRVRLGRLQSNARTKQFVVLGSIVGGILLVLILVGVYVLYAMRVSQMEKQTREMRELVDRYEFSKARSYLDDLQAQSAPVLQEPNFQTLVKRMQDAEHSAENTERMRRQEYEGLVSAGRTSPLRSREDLEPAALQKARERAKNPQEHAEIDRVVKERRQEWEKTLRDFRDRISRAANDVVPLEKMPLWELSQPHTEPKLNEQEKRADRIVLDAPVELKPEATAVRQRLDELRRRFDSGQRDANLVQQLNAALRLDEPLGEFLRVLDNYVDKYPESEHGKAFKQVLSLRSAWPSIFLWKRTAEARDRFSLSPRDATNRAGDCDMLLKQRHTFVEERVVVGYKLYLLGVAGRNATVTSNGPAAKLKILFKDPLVKDLWCLRTKDGKSYYIKASEAPKVQAQYNDKDQPLVNFNYITGYDGSTRRTGVNRANVTDFFPAPTGFLAELTLPEKEDLWEETLLTAADRLREETRLDPLWKLELLQRILTEAGNGSQTLALALKEENNRLQNAIGKTKHRWMQPDDKELQFEREKARKVLEKVPPLLPLTKVAEANRARLATILDRSQAAVAGCLLRDSERKWQLLTPRLLPDNAPLYVLNVFSGAQAWKEIGRVADGRVLWKQENQLEEGQLVFVLQGGR